MFDVSAAGAKVRVECGSNSCNITEFYDEGTPFETNEVEVTGSGITLNGQLVLWRKPVAYVVTLTVIPGSQDDVWLAQRLDDAHIRPGKVIDVDRLKAKLTIWVPQINASGRQGKTVVTSYTNGRILSGPTGPSASAEGKLAAKTYSFVFEDQSVAETSAGVDVG